jgi:aminoglycoside phosphotransferase (APT) family kinase protein
MKQPWESDIPFHIDEVRAIVQQHTGRDHLRIQKMDEGWDMKIFLVNEELIFRFTKREFVIPFIQTEILALPMLEGRLTSPIPQIRYRGLFKGSYPYFAYPMIPGEIAAGLSLTPSERQQLITPVTRFMNELHAIPLTDEMRTVIRGDTIGRLNIARRTEQIKERLPLTRSLSIPFSVDWIADLLAGIHQQDVEKVSCLVHGDLHVRNILVKERTTLAGVIDWTDIHIGHPAKDLAFAVSFFDPDAFRQVIAHYHTFRPAYFFLACFSALHLACRLTEYALDIEDKVLLEECKTSFMNIQQNFLTFYAPSRPPHAPL